jgi:hypothetical protein
VLTLAKCRGIAPVVLAMLGGLRAVEPCRAQSDGVADAATIDVFARIVAREMQALPDRKVHAWTIATPDSTPEWRAAGARLRSLLGVSEPRRGERRMRLLHLNAPHVSGDAVEASFLVGTPVRCLPHSHAFSLDVYRVFWSRSGGVGSARVLPDGTGDGWCVPDEPRLGH